MIKKKIFGTSSCSVKCEFCLNLSLILIECVIVGGFKFIAIGNACG